MWRVIRVHTPVMSAGKAMWQPFSMYPLLEVVMGCISYLWQGAVDTLQSFRKCKRVLEPNLGPLNQQYNHIIIFGIAESCSIPCPGIRVTLILRYLEGRTETMKLHGLRKVWLRVALLFLKRLGKVILNGIKLPGIWANVSPLGES